MADSKALRTYQFRDPGMPTLEITSASIEDAVATQAGKRDYTRLYQCNGKRWRLVCVRELGGDEWRDWQAMSFLEKRQWEEQDGS